MNKPLSLNRKLINFSSCIPHKLFLRGNNIKLRETDEVFLVTMLQLESRKILDQRKHRN